jgi:hypothetical protein
MAASIHTDACGVIPLDNISDKQSSDARRFIQL